MSINFKLNWAMTPLSNIFIEEYMTMPVYPVYSLVYIYTLKKAISGEEITNELIAEHFQIMESEVTKIWQYWEKAGLIKQSEEDGKLNIEFLTPNSKLIKPELQQMPRQPKLRPENKPRYNPDDIQKISLQDKQISELLQNAEKLLGKPLSINDIGIIVSLYDWYGLPIEVIYVLLNHCGMHKKGMRYIEKTAIDWADKEIKDVDAAEEYLNIFLNEYKKIMRAYGITDRAPSEEEQNYMSSWVRKLKMPIEVIKEACSRTISNTGKVSFPYTNKILNDWYNAGVQSVGQIKLLDAEYNSKKTDSVKQKKPFAAANRFNDYDQRHYDETTLENIFKRKAGD